jgi:hypothetical protein
MKKIKLAFFDFDGCLADTPNPDFGKNHWGEHHKTTWPYQGWWGRVESMCLDAFKIKTHEPQHQAWTKLYNEGYKTFILTSRQPKFAPIIQSILIDNEIDIDDIFTMSHNLTKGERILKEVQGWIADGFQVEHVVFYDDRMKEIVSVQAVVNQLKEFGTTIEIIKVQSDAID